MYGLSQGLFKMRPAYGGIQLWDPLLQADNLKMSLGINSRPISMESTFSPNVRKTDERDFQTLRKDL